MTAMAAAGVSYANDGDNGQKMHHDGGKWCHHGNDAAHALLHLLPEEKRKALHEAMEKIHKENTGLHEQKHKLHEELDALLKAPSFDKDAFLAKQAELDALQQKMKKNAEKEFASVAASFNTEDRRILAELRHTMHHHHGMHHHHDGEHMEHHDDASKAG